MIGAAITLRILMIGNSFSVCVGNNLPQIVQSDPDCNVVLTSAYIGGCPLERHWNNVVEAEAKPEAKQYDIRTWTTKTGDKRIDVKNSRGNINSLIKTGDYDIITIQQASHKSWDYATYQPYADQLIDYIKKNSPKSKIWIQQTWAYRCDDGRLQPGSEWGFDQTGMYQRLTKAYGELAAHTGFPVIPQGRAVQLYRAQERDPFKPATQAEKAACRWPDFPKQSGDVVGKYTWWKEKKTGHLKVGADPIHLNHRGEYLQACVWFMALFGRDLPAQCFVPGDIDDRDAAVLQNCAREAVKAGCKLVP